MILRFLYLFTGLTVLGASALALMIYRKLEDQEEKAMASFQLKPETVKHEFTVLTAGTMFVAMAGAMYGMSSMVTRQGLVISFSNLTGGVYATLLFYVVYSWWRRF
ncbi:MAG: hypothetical protein ABEK01_05240 [Candidatus Nanohaloarchaea archaeon]